MTPFMTYLIDAGWFVIKIFFLSCFLPGFQSALTRAAGYILERHDRYLNGNFRLMVLASFLLTFLAVWAGQWISREPSIFQAWFDLPGSLFPLSADFNAVIAICLILAFIHLISLKVLLRSLRRLHREEGSYASLFLLGVTFFFIVILIAAAIFGVSLCADIFLLKALPDLKTVFEKSLGLSGLLIDTPRKLLSHSPHEITVAVMGSTIFIPSMLLLLSAHFLTFLSLFTRFRKSGRNLSNSWNASTDREADMSDEESYYYTFREAKDKGPDGSGYARYMREKLEETRNRFDGTRKEISAGAASLSKRLSMPEVIKKIFFRLFFISLFLFFAGTAASGVYYILLPGEEQLAVTMKHVEIKIEKRGEKIDVIDNIRKLPVEYESLPPHLTHALIAQEDRRFMHHYGFDFRGMGRAIYETLVNGNLQGGSTISQQLGKNIMFSPDQNLYRKFLELILAIKIEINFEKTEILEGYFNQASFGNGCYGVEAAARYYFRKRAKDLNLYESALLIGSLPAPNVYNIFKNPRIARKRASLVLAQMVGQGFITEKDAQKAERTGIQRGYRVLRNIEIRYFLDWTREDILRACKGINGEMTIVTTMIAEVQVYAELSLDKMFKKKALKNAEGALLAMRPDGSVIAMIGGRDYGKSQFNRAFQARRQPGSLMKLFPYLAALESGMEPEDRISDLPIHGKWPRNWDGIHKSSVTLSDALSHSRNAATVRLTENVGVSQVIKTARRLGIESPLPNEAGMVLGTAEVTMVEMVSAYAVLGNDGREVHAYGIHLIRDNRGRILYQHSKTRPKRIIKEKDCQEMTKMLRKVVTSGTGQPAGIDLASAAGKTGTTQNYRDAWFVGYTDKLIAGIWTGRDDGGPMHHISGGHEPAAAWQDFMSDVHQYLDL